MSTPSPPPSQRLEIPPGLPRPGELLAGKYTVERLLGMGGMGVVLAARHVDLDERVAIKMLLPHVQPQGEPVARFIREARAAIKIRNEHVVRVLDVGRLESGAPYIVMEYLEGSDLGQLVDRGGPLAVEAAIDYVTQACEAIAAAHAIGIIHRDLKPANLFLARAGDGRPTVKVLDFGISKISESSPQSTPGLTNTATIMGTPSFMSPEQLRSTRDVDARADIWSMGAIVHALLTGQPPYEGESNADVSAKIIRDAPTPLRQLRADVPEALEAIVLRCLDKEPSRRFGDIAELAQALGGVSTRDSVRAMAARVVRVAAGVAPTLMSTPDVRPGVAPQAPSDPGATRTSSAWGETRREEKKARS
ncbi:MAG TPA: serine/threonine-protein kinase, partial [Polyangiaceae bacterium]